LILGDIFEKKIKLIYLDKFYTHEKYAIYVLNTLPVH